MKIVCVGHATYDITLPVSEYPKENYKHKIDERVECGGGPASTAAYLLAKWKEEVAYVGMVGNDYYGQAVIKELNSAGVNTEYVEKNSSASTDTSYIISNTSNGSRTILTSKTKEFSSLSNPIDLVDAEYILVDGEHHETAKEVILRNPKAISILDAGKCKKEVANLGTIVNYLICSKEFAETFTNIKIDNNYDTLIAVYEKMSSVYQKQTIIITLEGYGSFTKINDNYKIIPSISVKAVDSTGAGDIFHGAFTYFISQGNDLEKTIILSSITAAISVTKVGTRFSIPTLEEVLNTYSKYEVI